MRWTGFLKPPAAGKYRFVLAHSGLAQFRLDGRVVLDASHDGRVLARAPSGNGVDIIAYDAKLSHLYVPGGDAADLTIIGVGSGGALNVLGKVPTARGAHCVAADDRGNVYVCDPGRGRLLTFRDPFPASR